MSVHHNPNPVGMRFVMPVALSYLPPEKSALVLWNGLAWWSLRKMYLIWCTLREVLFRSRASFKASILE